MRLLIQKFGGTSVQTKKNRLHVIKQIKRRLQQDYKIVVVVSAFGRKPDPYATDTLLSLVNYPMTNNSKRELDMLMSCGEIVASVVLSNELQSNDIRATALTGAQAGIITNQNYNDAKIIRVNPDRILQELKQFDVIVVAGFQGMTETGDMTTIGRGGSDTTAAALGAALNAQFIEIYTDVTGIMTADPRMVHSAKQIDILTYAEICNFAYHGAKVIHPRAVEIAMQAKIPIKIRSTYSEEEGTLITSSRGKQAGIDILDRVVTGIAHIDSISQFIIDLDSNDVEAKAIIFHLMADAHISVDFITISTMQIMFTIPAEVTEFARDLFKKNNFQVNVIKNCAKVSCVGAGMTGVPGVAATIVDTLVKNDIEILQSADSHTTIWVLIRENCLKKAVNALHDAFELYKPMNLKKF